MGIFLIRGEVSKGWPRKLQYETFLGNERGTPKKCFTKI
jgi:hypothetical protein